MNQELSAELTRILQAITIVSPTAYSFAGKLVTLSDGVPQPVISPGIKVTNPLVSSLQQMLYQYCYCHGFTGDLPDDAGIQPQDLVSELTTANSTRERWDAGWQIQQHLHSGQIVASKGGATRVLWPGEFMTHEGPGIAPRAGTLISIFVPKESRTMQPGFYFVFAEAVTDQQHDHHLVRFYWNVQASGAADLISLITQNLNRFQVPFRFKCGGLSVMFSRTDAAVLYVSRRFYQITATLLRSVYPGVRAFLEPATPLFTKQLAPGLALAEDPANGESFGTSRCRILAEAIWSGYELSLQTASSRLDEVVKQFERNGLAMERPYLNAGSVDSYDFYYEQASSE